jgi:hypothetical protein
VSLKLSQSSTILGKNHFSFLASNLNNWILKDENSAMIQPFQNLLSEINEAKKLSLQWSLSL